MLYCDTGGALSELSNSMAVEAGDPRAPDLRGLGIMQLLKQASWRRGSTATTTTVSVTVGSSNSGLEMAIARLTGSGETFTCAGLLPQKGPMLRACNPGLLGLLGGDQIGIRLSESERRICMPSCLLTLFVHAMHVVIVHDICTTPAMHRVSGMRKESI